MLHIFTYLIIFMKYINLLLYFTLRMCECTISSPRAGAMGAKIPAHAGLVAISGKSRAGPAPIRHAPRGLMLFDKGQ